MRMTHTIDSLNLVEFAMEYPNKWHTFGNDAKTRKAVKRAEHLGRIKTNEFNQFKLIED